MNATQVPLFPLNTVLFPGGILPLRIFEPRYLDMVRRCMRDSSAFGVILLREGREVDAKVKIYSVGTLAQVVDFDLLPDNLLGITARGTERFRCLDWSTQSDGLHVARIESLAPERKMALPPEFSRLARLLEEALPRMGDFFQHLEPQYEDAAWVSGRLAEVLPLALPDKQRLLEMDDPLERLRILGPAIRGEAGN